MRRWGASLPLFGFKLSILNDSMGACAQWCEQRPTRVAMLVGVVTFAFCAAFAWLRGALPDAFISSVIPQVLLNVALALGCSALLRRRSRNR